MPRFLKMPAFSPRCGMAVFQFPRWPIASLTKSSAAAGVRVESERRCRSAKVVIEFLFTRHELILPLAPSAGLIVGRETGEPADQRIGADRDHEQDVSNAYMRGMSNRL